MRSTFCTLCALGLIILTGCGDPAPGQPPVTDASLPQADGSGSDVAATPVAADTEATDARLADQAAPASGPDEAAPETVAPARQEEGIVLRHAPGGAMSISQLRASGAGPGDAVVVRAQIGGRNPPWISGAGIMMLADTGKLAACGPGGCGAPWDFCHVPPDQLQTHTLVVRWLGADGQPRRQGFDQILPIAPLATVVVSGTLAEIPGSPVVVIDCDGIHLEDIGPFGNTGA
ncbi:MAG: hypothetical protein ACOCXJ_07075 [Planctomycetota bacterium]